MPGNGLIQCYNGVMLCNRPVFRPSQVPNINRNSHKGNTTNHEKKDSGSGSKGNSFLCGTLSKPWGMNVKIPEKSRVLSRLSRTDGALSRHKLWLREMQEKKEKDAKQIQDEKMTKERKLKEFMERQAKLRAKARSEKQVKIDDAILEQEHQSEEENNNNSKGNIAGEKRCRPAWSLTESDAQNVQDESQAREEEELMNYVDNLDFESYYDDWELSVLMSQVKERIKKLEKEKKKDESKLKATIEVRIISDQV